MEISKHNLSCSLPMQHAFFSCIHSATQYIACILYFNWAFFSVGKESACNAGDLGSIPWRRKWPPIPVFLPGEFHGQRNLVGYSPKGCGHDWATNTFTSLSDKKSRQSFIVALQQQWEVKTSNRFPYWLLEVKQTGFLIWGEGGVCVEDQIREVA